MKTSNINASGVCAGECPVSGKKMWIERESAHLARSFAYGKAKKKKIKLRLAIYKCPSCGTFHLTKNLTRKERGYQWWLDPNNAEQIITHNQGAYLVGAVMQII